MNKAYQAWIYAYVKVHPQNNPPEEAQQERNRLSDNPNDTKAEACCGLERGDDNLEHHRSDTDVQQLEHSLVQPRARAVARLVTRAPWTTPLSALS